MSIDVNNSVDISSDDLCHLIELVNVIFSNMNRLSAMDARLQTVTSSGAVYSIISVHKLLYMQT